jgi:hypothetical protein
LSATAVHHQTAANDRLSVAGVDIHIAFGADDTGLDTVAAGLMQKVHRLVGQTSPLVAPLHQRHIHRKQCAAFGR